MRKYEFLDGYPYFPAGEGEEFRIASCMIHRLKNGQIINSLDFNSSLPPDFPEKWLRQFWKDLEAAPQFIVREDQWSSDYCSILAGHLIAWRDDRKEGSNFLERAIEIEKSLEHWSVSEAVRAWVKTQLG